MEEVTLKDSSVQRATRDRYAAIMRTLWQQPDEAVRSDSGVATQILFDLVPESYTRSRLNSDRPMTLSGFHSGLAAMQAYGWITMDKNSKRTHLIKLASPPNDWVPPEDEPEQETGLELAASQAIENDGVEESLSALEGQPYDDEAREGGIRPGRLAAKLERIESSIPALVEQGVIEGINGWMSQVVQSLGFVLPSERTTQLDTQLSEAYATIATMTEELQAERRAGHQAREELNGILRRVRSTTEMSPVKPADLQEAWRDLGRHAIANGWTIHRTGGGHLQWKSPTGFRYFSSATSSDYRSVRNARADMEKEGLPSV